MEPNGEVTTKDGVRMMNSVHEEFLYLPFYILVRNLSASNRKITKGMISGYAER